MGGKIRPWVPQLQAKSMHLNHPEEKKLKLIEVGMKL